MQNFPFIFFLINLDNKDSFERPVTNSPVIEVLIVVDVVVLVGKEVVVVDVDVVVVVVVVDDRNPPEI